MISPSCGESAQLQPPGGNLQSGSTTDLISFLKNLCFSIKQRHTQHLRQNHSSHIINTTNTYEAKRTARTTTTVGNGNDRSRTKYKKEDKNKIYNIVNYVIENIKENTKGLA